MTDIETFDPNLAPKLVSKSKGLNKMTTSKCATCKGEGYEVYYENQSPLGSGMVWNEEIIEECPDCLELGICPNCSTQWGDADIEKYLAYVEYETKNKFHSPLCNFDNWG